MPTYAYKCEKCEHGFEVIQKMSDNPLIHCPACENETLRKVISNGNFQLKGKGWFKDGY